MENKIKWRYNAEKQLWELFINDVFHSIMNSEKHYEYVEVFKLLNVQ